MDGRCKGPDGVHEGVVVVVLGDCDVLFFIFWSSNVQVNRSDFARLGSWRCNPLFPEKKRMLWMQQSLVFRLDVALTYLQDMQAQKKLAMERVLSAFWVCVVDRL